MARESILARLAPLLTNQIENVATDALAHLLLQYPCVSDAFKEYISAVGIDLPDNLTIKTQVRAQDAAIPDLVGMDAEGHHLVIIESKFWASLTPNQPTTYIKRLPPDKQAMLLFVAPASRTEMLWQELLDKCNFPAIGSSSQQETTTVQFLTQRLNNNHILALTSWESLLEVLHQKAEQERNQYATGDIWQLQSLCARIDGEKITPTQMRIEEFRGLVDALVSRLVDSGIASIERYKATPGPGFYKRYMSIHGIPNWCIEFNESLRKQHPPTNLWLTIYKKPALSDVLTELASVGFPKGKQFLIPLEIPESERAAVVNSLFLQVVDIAKKMITPEREI